MSFNLNAINSVSLFCWPFSPHIHLDQPLHLIGSCYFMTQYCETRNLMTIGNQSTIVSQNKMVQSNLARIDLFTQAEMK